MYGNTKINQPDQFNRCAWDIFGIPNKICHSESIHGAIQHNTSDNRIYDGNWKKKNTEKVTIVKYDQHPCDLLLAMSGIWITNILLPVEMGMRLRELT